MSLKPSSNQRLPDFLRSLGKEDLKPGGSYAAGAALERLQLRAGERLLVIGPGAASSAVHIALTRRVDACALITNESERVPCDDISLGRRLTASVGGVEALPFDKPCFDSVLVEATLAELPPARQAAALKEIARVMKAGGRIALNELAWHQPPTPEIEARLREIWGGPVHPHVARGWWDLLEGAGFGNVQSDLAVVTYFTRKGMESDEGANAMNVFHAAFENREALKRFTQAHQEFEENRRYYGVIIAAATKAVSPIGSPTR